MVLQRCQMGLERCLMVSVMCQMVSGRLSQEVSNGFGKVLDGLRNVSDVL